MKNIAVIILVSLITSCNAQKKIIMKKFDIEKFNKNKNYLNRFIDTLDNGTIIEQNIGGDGYYEVIKKKKEYFEEYFEYFKSGKLKLGGEYFPNDFNKGVWKNYDEQGNLIKETNYDKGFDYTWEDLLKLLKKRKVDILGRYTTIRKEEGDWRFSYVEGIYIYDVIVDGKTGKILQDAKNEFEEGS